MKGIALKAIDGGRTQICLENHNHDSLGETLRTVPATAEQVRAALEGHTYRLPGETRADRRARILAVLDTRWPRPQSSAPCPECKAPISYIRHRAGAEKHLRCTRCGHEW